VLGRNSCSFLKDCTYDSQQNNVSVEHFNMFLKDVSTLRGFLNIDYNVTY